MFYLFCLTAKRPLPLNAKSDKLFSMRFSQLFTKTSKDYPKDETSVSCQLLLRAGYIDKVAAGIYTLLPLGFKTIQNIIGIVREEMTALGGQEILMPGLIPQDFLVMTDRWKTLDVLFKVEGQNDKHYGLGATHEEIVTPMARGFILSYRDLPFSVFQIQNKFRNEIRAKSGVLRTREFLMKDLYSFHTDEEDLDKFYDSATQAYWKIFERVGIKDKTRFVYASGGTFSQYSHEFQTETEAGEDEIYLCKQCATGVNREIVTDGFKCPACQGEEYEIKKAIETGNIFKLKTKFSEPFDLNFVDQDGSKKLVQMGCYGIGIQRLMGAVAEINHDDKGLIWPKSVAPYQVHLLALGDNHDRAEEIYKTLHEKGVEVLYDDRDISAGEKFADADLMGLPVRLVISERTGEQIEMKNRHNAETELLSTEEVFNRLTSF